MNLGPVVPGGAIVDTTYIAVLLLLRYSPVPKVLWCRKANGICLRHGNGSTRLVISDGWAQHGGP